MKSGKAVSRWRVLAGTLAVVFTLLVGTSARATVTTYTSQSAFFNALTDPAYFESFNAYSGQTVVGPQSFTFGPVGFTLTDLGSNTLLYSTNAPLQGSVFPTASSPTDSIRITFTGRVTAVGGTFFLTNFGFIPLSGMNGNVTATLSTGEQIVLVSSSTYANEPFGGFVSTTPITSLTLTSLGLAGTAAARISLDNLYISGTAVPEPGTWALLAGGGTVLLYAARRRAAH